MDAPTEHRTEGAPINLIPSGSGDSPDLSDFQKTSPSNQDVPTLGDFFTIKRGIETGDNDFFIVTPAEAIAHNLPMKFLRPILPSPHNLPDDEIIADPEGYPILDGKLFVVDCPLPEREIKANYPALWTYLERGIEAGVPERYSCRHRTPWYAQERRPPALYLCAYMGLGWYDDETPFRFILNHSRAVAPNVYLMMYPRPALARLARNDYTLQIKLWTTLNGIGANEIGARNRIYGSTPGRLEPMELASVPANRIVALIPDLVPDSTAQLNLFE